MMERGAGARSPERRSVRVTAVAGAMHRTRRRGERCVCDHDADRDSDGDLEHVGLEVGDIGFGGDVVTVGTDGLAQGFGVRFGMAALDAGPLRGLGRR